MRIFQLVLSSILLFLFAVPAVGEIPLQLFTQNGFESHGFPDWVDARLAVNADRQLETQLFHELAISRLEDLLSGEPNSDGCLEATEHYVSEVNSPDRSSLAKAVADSSLIFKGRIIDRAFGFRWSEPGQVLEVEVVEELRGAAKHPRHFVFVPVARFPAGSFEICKTDDRYSRPPEVGEEVVLLVSSRRDTGEKLLRHQDATEMVFLYADGTVGYPIGWDHSSSPGETLVQKSDLLSFLSRLLS
ncbi:MAG: hypothetical protein AAGD01_18960 [Acidobacteriota bacterium]